MHTYHRIQDYSNCFFRQKLISAKRNGTNFSSEPPSNEQLWVRKDIDPIAWTIYSLWFRPEIEGISFSKNDTIGDYISREQITANWYSTHTIIAS